MPNAKNIAMNSESINNYTSFKIIGTIQRQRNRLPGISKGFFFASFHYDNPTKKKSLGLTRHVKSKIHSKNSCSVFSGLSWLYIMRLDWVLKKSAYYYSSHNKIFASFLGTSQFKNSTLNITQFDCWHITCLSSTYVTRKWKNNR